jgi:hypothetical protein
MTRTNILITGASSGLGAEMARQFAARGRNLALVARRTDRLDDLREEILAARPELTIVVRELDVNDHGAVFQVFRACQDELGTLDRVIVNAGLGKGQPIGTGKFAANRDTAQTNFVAALAQCEAAMEIFRERNAGHLVVISSMSGIRGMPRNMATYAASKAAVATLAEGIRAEMIGKPIDISTIFPGYIRSEMNDRLGRPNPLMVDTEVGVRSMVRAIEREQATAHTPVWPWAPLSVALRFLPLSLVAKLG